VCRAWRRLGQAGLAGAAVRWRDHEIERHGRARGIDLDGALLVECDGRVERLIAGDVEWETWARE
jgi:biotin-(acetyl-CoA carboxylase) ligase